MPVTSDLINHYYGTCPHPYQLLRREVDTHLNHTSTVLDLGCGHDAPELQRIITSVRLAIGLDPVARSAPALRADAAYIPLASASVDLAYSRSVLEHLPDPLSVFREVRRVLRPGGRFIALTPNLWDYATLASMLIPNRLHPWVVRHTEGRAEEDTFPAYYRANSVPALRSLAEASGFTVQTIRHLNQYPAYLQFNRTLFRLGVMYERLTSRYGYLRHLRGWLLVELRATV